ncbi:Sulfotransferase domain [Dillenia turbinata]|uniref:Sulfotransferase n=1 Tax=Dillenia turbinata TaxID=194707 RepID=A0AAN8UZT1_9MAGN
MESSNSQQSQCIISSKQQVKDESSKHQPDYDDIITTLPVGESWNLPSNLYKYQGFWCTPEFLNGVISAKQRFKPLDKDVILCTYPKSGTNWLKALAFSIMTRTKFDFSSHPLLTTPPISCVSYIEFEHAQGVDASREFPLTSTHIPYSSLPDSIISSDCKIVYICRDPKDVFVSWWYHVNYFVCNDKGPISLEKAFDLFCQGIVLFGPFWDHVLEYWKASLERPDKILFLKYEDLKRDPSYYVKNLAVFMGYPFSLQEKAEGCVEKIIELCSFETLGNLEVNKSGKLQGAIVDAEHPAKIFFRKGKIGDWKNHLTGDMANRLDRIIEEKLSGSGLKF